MVAKDARFPGYPRRGSSRPRLVATGRRRRCLPVSDLKQAPEDALALRLSARAAANLDKDQSAIAIYSRLTTTDLEPDDYYLLGRCTSANRTN